MTTTIDCPQHGKVEGSQCGRCADNEMHRIRLAALLLDAILQKCDYRPENQNDHNY